MAPSRRKGAGKAAVAAASLRQWKVGDLVLAKVKGFPAWPATVSEPEKWGYSADWKKVLVYFFGTQQIAFCNPTDVEAFTEEKKQSLLVKRQGKGADFVRAVQEIIDCHEKLKKCDNNDEIISSDDVARVNGGSVVDSSANVGSKDETEPPLATNNNVQSNNSLSSRDTSEPVLPIKIVLASEQGNSLLDKEALQDESTDAAASEQPFPASTSSRKRSGGSRLKSAVTKRNASVQRSRSSSRVGSRRLQRSSIPFNSGDKVTNNIPEELLRQNKRNRKSPDGSDCDDATSEALISNVSIEDNASEIVTADSDTYSLNECSTIDSGCKLEHSETAVECLEREVEFGKGLDLHIKAVVIKKKRKPMRKRVINDASKDNGGAQDKEEIMEAVVDDSNQCLQNDCENRTERCSKEDGDEHLPLVKRARVRMSKLSSSEECKRHSDTEEQNQKEAVAINLTGKVEIDSNSADGSIDRGLDTANGVPNHTSPSKVCTQFSSNWSQLCNLKKDQSFCCSVDGESVLPPSKRLHRALEAMSANAAEEGQAAAGTTISMRTSMNGLLITSTCSSSHFPMEIKEGNCLGPQSRTSHDDPSKMEDERFSISVNHTITEENGKPPLKVDFGHEADQNSQSQRHDFKDALILEGEGKHIDIADHRDPQPGCHSDRTVVHVNSVKKESPSRKLADVRSNCGEMVQLLPLENEGNTVIACPHIVLSENPDEHLESSENMVRGLVAGPSDIARLSHHNGSDDMKCGADDNTVATSPKPAPAENCEETTMHDVKEVNGRDSVNDQPSPFAGDHVVQKDVSEVQSSLSVSCTDNSLTMDLVDPISISDRHGFLNKSISFSPKKSVGVLEEVKFESAVTLKLKPMGKDVEAHAALSSFEAMLGNLTRTKDSIGRATRVAIECAKLGVGSKVVEVLTRTLDTESSLHKKLDLFFLIDSITQSSQNLKGNVADIYPPAIQLVLSRLLAAVAPPGSNAQENRKQCIKVLRLWSQRGVLPESIIRHHMRELESLSGKSSVGAYSRRSSRTERSLDDPLREMEGMLVDEYGSNSSFQIPGFCMPQMLKDEDGGSDSDDGSFEAVTPEHTSQACDEPETVRVMEKHRHILEDVDGELEMEDVAPPCEVEMSSSNSIVVNAIEAVHNKFVQHFPPRMPPPLPQDVPPSCPPLPSSPPPQPPPLPPSFSRSDTCASDFELERSYMDTNNVQDNSMQLVGQSSNTSGTTQRTSDAVHYPTSSNASGTSQRTSDAVHYPASSNAGITQRTSDAVQYPASERRDLQMQMPESTSRSFSNIPARVLNNGQHDDSTALHNSGYPLRPPHPPPQDQFTYVHGDHRMKPRWEDPPASYSSRFRYAEDTDGEYFYNDHERMRHYSYEPHENWRVPRPFYGSRYHDRGRTSYGPVSCGGTPCEPTRLHSQRWRFPSRDINSRSSMPYRQPYDGPVRVSNRGSRSPKRSKKMGASHSVAEKSIHEFTVKDFKGKDVNLNDYKGKILLVVNVASKCGFTDLNYKQLTELYNRYKDEDFEILAFPCNQFLKQEPGTSETAQEFACTRYKAEYPIFQKIRVNGPDTAPVYKFLKATSNGFLGTRIKWNFTKFLVDKEGVVINRYGPSTTPLSIESDIKKALGVA
ncbi:protein HUA2-LIKE 2-like [Cucurbita pepo subsp. pepo]|uniref:protein HUA2-LIKE 2-like n=1 Tax=Cucurbita pepo subsp. pepo TaxID=3664 RepID=UPI000C9D4F0B|nr:protein HUA2-LIKE 2-like [Cucurbita pepo subsp. pepo]